MKILLIIGLWYLGIGCGMAVLYHAYMVLTILIAKRLNKKDELPEDEYSYIVKVRGAALTIPNMFYIILEWPVLIIASIILFKKGEGI